MGPRQPHKLLLQQGPSVGATYPLDRPELVIGREPGVDILIDSAGVSRRHARVFLQNDQDMLEDLGSSNGTFVNGERLNKPRRLKHGDIIQLGQMVSFAYQGDQPPVSSTMIESGQPRIVQVQTEHTMIEGKLPEINQTMIGEELMPSRSASPAQLIVAIAGETLQTYTLNQPKVSIGRAEDNQIVINSRIVSRYHAYLERMKTGYYQIVSLQEAGNPVLLEGRPLTSPHPLHHGDTLRIGSTDPGLMVTMTYVNPSQMVESQASPIRFGEKTLIQIGRDPSNEVVIDSPNVSRFHAQVERVGQRYRLIDLHSGNGTFINDERVTGDTWLQPNDVIRVGRHRFVMGENELGQYDETHGLNVDAINLNKWVRKDLNILKNISLAFKPREFIVVVGQSGGGKSTLVDAIAGYRPATHGMVLVNGTNIYRNFEAVINDIGFVPQRDIIHYELTVYQALEYAAKLRMPRDTSKEERHKRVMETLENLDLVERKDIPIHKLSGGQIKRVSIGVELLTKPGLFFLDEPTSGLDPGTETAFMHLMRRLADQGRTIIMVTHATKNVMLADKVVFLARGGYLAWFGPPEEALKYFDRYRNERERRAKEMDFDQIYAILDDSSKGSAQDWASRYLEDPAYQKYVAVPLKEAQAGASQAKAGGQTVKEAAPKAKRKSRASALHQFFVLSARNLKILSRDKTSLVLMLLAPIFIAALDLVLAPLMGRDIFSYATGNATNIGVTFFLMSIDALLVGGFSQMREFIKESDIYKRERLVNLKIFPYVASKVWIALLLAFYQAAAFTAVRFLAFDIPGGQLTIGLFYISMVLAVLAGMMSGLLASAISPTASSAPLLMILLIVPQIVLSGALAPMPDKVSAIASTRWTFESTMGITGFGADVAADPCWQLSSELRDAMTLEDKQNMGCRCLGTAIFTPGSCNFPGLGKYYKPEVDQPAPEKPAPLGEKPPEPVIPEAPKPPADQNDQVAMVKYLNSLQTYQDQVKQIQDQYRAQMSQYENQAKIYQAQMEAYQKDRLAYEAGRSTAVNSAEGTLEMFKEKYGSSFVNKNDPAIFWPWLFKAWTAQLIIIGVYFALILVIFKRKDA
jgi:ABC transport system ATP-binding/permease protein